MSTHLIPTPEAGDTPTPGDEISSQKLASVSLAPAVAAPSTDVTESPEGAAEPDRPVEEPRSHMPTRAPAAVSQHQAFPSFMRRYIDMTRASGPEMDQPRLPPAGFVPRILRGTGIVTTPITPSQPPREAASVPAALAPGSICPTCQSRVPARLSAAERQRAYRERKRKQSKPIPLRQAI
jgi:hypothetical protein